MKKVLFFAASAALMFASCANDDVIESAVNSDSNKIAFNVLTDGVTRAADVTTANLASFNVTGIKETTSTTYIDNVTYTKDGTVFKSATDYNWPSDENLTFWAYAPATLAGTGITKKTYNTFTLAPVATAASQGDLVAAKAAGKNKGNSASGVSLTFAHAGSKITVKAKNSDAYLSVDVKNIKIVGIANQGDASFATGTWAWSNLASVTKTNAYTFSWTNAATSPKVTFNGKVTDATALTAATNDWIMVPQTTVAADNYLTNKIGANLNGAYIALDVEIYKWDGSARGALVYSGWACFPFSTTWAAGKHYTYVIDLAGGGYKETNTDDNNPSNVTPDSHPNTSNDGDTSDDKKDSSDDGTNGDGGSGNGTDDNKNHPTDPILKKDVIKFISVTVSDWTDGGSTNL